MKVYRQCLRNFHFSHLQSKTNTPDRRIGLARTTSTMQTQLPGSLSDYQIDPYRLLEDDLKDLFEHIRQVNIFILIPPLALFYNAFQTVATVLFLDKRIFVIT